MAAITIDSICICYDAALSVERGMISRSQASKQAVRDSGMNETSAQNYFNNVFALLAGNLYKRTMNPDATAYIVDRIAEDFGTEKARDAAKAVFKHLEYYAQLENGGPQKAVRKVAEAAMAKLGPPTLDAVVADETKRIEFAMALSSSQRQARLLDAPEKPGTLTVITQVFLRNADVVAEVLYRAKGTCEACFNLAPFQRKKDGSHYLEVHHRLQLAKGGLDTVSNAIALCPNCHREAHYGTDKDKFIV